MTKPKNMWLKERKWFISAPLLFSHPDVVFFPLLNQILRGGWWWCCWWERRWRGEGLPLNNPMVLVFCFFSQRIKSCCHSCFVRQKTWWRCIIGSWPSARKLSLTSTLIGASRTSCKRLWRSASAANGLTSIQQKVYPAHFYTWHVLLLLLYFYKCSGGMWIQSGWNASATCQDQNCQNVAWTKRSVHLQSDLQQIWLSAVGSGEKSQWQACMCAELFPCQWPVAVSV